MNIVRRLRMPGGWMVTVEVPTAFTKASNVHPVTGAPTDSRFDDVFVSDAAVRGKSGDVVRQAVRDALADPFEGIDLDTPVRETKALLEARMGAQYATWQLWKNTRVEATARELAGAIVTALTNRENAAWSDYAASINAWRSAP